MQNLRKTSLGLGVWTNSKDTPSVNIDISQNIQYRKREKSFSYSLLVHGGKLTHQLLQLVHQTHSLGYNLNLGCCFFSRKWKASSGGIHSMCLCSSSRLLTADREIKMWDLATRTLIQVSSSGCHDLCRWSKWTLLGLLSGHAVLSPAVWTEYVTETESYKTKT